MKVGIDIDGVLADFDTAFVAKANEVIPGIIPRNFKHTSWDYDEYLNQEQRDQIWEHIKKSNQFWISLKPFNGNMNFLKGFFNWIKFAEKQVEVYFVTSRITCGSETMLSETNRWLNSHLWGYHNWSVVGSPSRQKGVIYEALGIEYSIDDYAENVKRCLSIEGHQAFLLNRDYNQDPELDKVRLNDLNDYFNKIVIDQITKEAE